MTLEEKDALNKQMNNFLNDYEYELENVDYERLYHYLAEKETFTALQYRFLCWTGAKLGKPVKVNSPYISIPRNYEITEFKKEFLYAPKRTKLFDSLVAYIEKLKVQQKIQGKFDVLIGGSFTDPNYDHPDDIDAIILLSETQKSNFALHEAFQKMIKNFTPGIDVHFLPADYDLKHYKAYSNISYLSSKPDDKQKETEIDNNTFTQRRLVRISL